MWYSYLTDAVPYRAVKVALELGVRHLVAQGDSELVVKQVGERHAMQRAIPHVHGLAVPVLGVFWDPSASGTSRMGLHTVFQRVVVL